MALPNDFLKYEIKQILSLQENFKGLEGLYKLISLSSSPTAVQFVVAPAVSALLGGPMVETLVTTAAVDYASIILKLLLQEHRPYWYVNEPVYAPGTRPNLRQFDITCESTSGGPSGHSAMMTTMAYLFRRWIVEYLGTIFDVHKLCINIPTTSTMVILIFLCWSSRMYFASHFMHQCVSGTGLAMSVILGLEQDIIRRHLLTSKKKKSIGFAFGMIASAGIVYFSLTQLGIDPMWSVNKALQSCQKPGKVSWDSTPLYTISRNLGCTLGLSLCAPLRKKLKPPENWHTNVKATLGLVLIDTVILANAPQHLGGCMYFAYVFGASVFHTYAMIKIVPWLAKKLEESEEPPPKEEKPDEDDKKPDDKPKEGSKTEVKDENVEPKEDPKEDDKDDIKEEAETPKDEPPEEPPNEEEIKEEPPEEEAPKEEPPEETPAEDPSE